MKTGVLLALVVVVVVAEIVHADDATYARKEEALLKKLFENYNKDALPAKFTNVTLGRLDIQNLQLHEESHRLDIMAWFWVQWIDPRLTWDNKTVGIDQLSLTPGNVWMPDFSIYNAGQADTHLVTANTDFRQILYPNGQILYVPSVQFHFTCIMDLTYWPHDQHNCTLKIGSWVYHSNLVDLVLKNDSTKIEVKTQMTWSGNLTTSQWEIVETNVSKVTKYYDCCSEPYNAYLFTVILRRAAPYYNWVIKAPVICLTLLSVVVLLLPPSQSGFKVTFGGLLLIFDLVFLTFTADVVANNPSHTPLLVKLVVVELVVVSISVLVSGVVSWLAHSPHSSAPLPDPLRRFFVSLAHLLCLQSYVRQASGVSGMKQDEVEMGNDVAGEGGNGGKGGSEWLLLAAILDRIAFVVYLALTIIILISFGCVL